MTNFKFELWEIENGVVITRPILTTEDGETQVKNSSVYREDPLTAVMEIEHALAKVKAEFAKKTKAKP